MYFIQNSEQVLQLREHTRIVNIYVSLQEDANKSACWGYEKNCEKNNSYSVPSCPGDHKGWVRTKEDQINTFFTQGDFGYVRDQQKELMIMCEPNFAVCKKIVL